MQQLHTCLSVTVDTVESTVNTISNTQQTFCVSVSSLSNSCQLLVFYSNKSHKASVYFEAKLCCCCFSFICSNAASGFLFFVCRSEREPLREDAAFGEQPSTSRFVLFPSYPLKHSTVSILVQSHVHSQSHLVQLSADKWQSISSGFQPYILTLTLRLSGPIILPFH